MHIYARHSRAFLSKCCLFETLHPHLREKRRKKRKRRQNTPRLPRKRMENRPQPQKGAVAHATAPSCRLDRDAGVFECPLYGEQFVPTMKAYVLAPHTIMRRKRTCPTAAKDASAKRSQAAKKRRKCQMGLFWKQPPTCFRKNRTSKRLHLHWGCHIQTETKRKRAVANRFTFATSSFLFPDAGKYGHTALLFFSVYVLSSCILYAILQALLYASAKYCSYGIAA